MFPYIYAYEKLKNAVRILAISEGDVRSRLMNAFLEFHPLRAGDLPEHLRTDYEWIISELTKRKPRNEWEQLEWEKYGSVRANLRRMINRTGSRIAQKIYDLQYQIEQIYDEWYEHLKRNQT